MFQQFKGVQTISKISLLFQEKLQKKPTIFENVRPLTRIRRIGPPKKNNKKKKAFELEQRDSRISGRFGVGASRAEIMAVIKY